MPGVSPAGLTRSRFLGADEQEGARRLDSPPKLWPDTAVPRAPRYANYQGEFDPVEDQAWVADVLALPASRNPNRWRFRGKCSRCDHDIDIVLEIRSGQARPAVTAPPEALSTYVRRPAKRTLAETIYCNCTEPHDQREKGEKGCGIYGNLTLHLQMGQ
jgi:hypothetical protein